MLPRGDPSFSSEKMGTGGRSGSSAKKMGFSLCRSGIEVGSVSCTGQKVRSHCQKCIICPTQEGQGIPEVQRALLSPQFLHFLAKCSNLEITIRKYSLNSLVCLLLTCPEVFCSIAACSNAEMQLCPCSDSQSDGTFG